MDGIKKACRILGIVGAIFQGIASLIVLFIGVAALNPGSAVIDAYANTTGSSYALAEAALVAVAYSYIVIGIVYLIGTVLNIVVAVRAYQDESKAAGIVLGIFTILIGFLPAGILEIVKVVKNS